MGRKLFKAWLIFPENWLVFFDQLCALYQYSNTLKIQFRLSVHFKTSLLKTNQENFTKFKGKHLCTVFILINFNKKETLAQAFSCEIYEISKNTFLTEHRQWLLLGFGTFYQYSMTQKVRSKSLTDLKTNFYIFPK